MTTVSCCFLGFVPAIVIAAKANTRRAALWATGFTVAYLVGLALVGSQPEGANNIWSNVGGVLFFGTGVGALCYVAVVGPKLRWARTTRPSPVRTAAPVVDGAPPHDPNARAVAGVLAARQKRAEARAMAANDPQMARDLCIGRPDLPRHYDDGGLIDLNGAPAEVIARGLGLTQAQAEHIVEVRRQLGKFERVDDLVTLADLEPSVYDAAQERIILL
ncbi:helix-hairpin-helix domain-containing protein [Mumia sp. ZJ1417]|uniref:ComEA family DNA-binding protein n=1 Tax=unclassified Mumia TaxID=2621872 RepID=UPI001422E194|nr:MULTISPECIES: helix-hairpin-helix domain-containing protein [unclassified Mumia]QMW66584.1 helix-hairpin-helix domain-containing protein [Mumia sp. ZJ1417]